MFQRLKRTLSKRAMIALLCSLALELTIMLLFSGKSRIDLEAIVVSSNEEYLACFETGRGHKILCFCIDGSLAFDYNIPSEVSGGGHCALWFDADILCVFFYRTNKVVQFTMDGTILKTEYVATKQYTPPEIFTTNIMQLVGLVVKRFALSDKFDLWIDLGDYWIVFVIWEDETESWRFFTPESDDPHLVVSSSWLCLDY